MGLSCAARFNRKAFRLVGAPAVEPVSLSDMKTFLKDPPSSDDAVISLLISTARRAAEEYTKRAFISQTWELVMDGFEQDDCEDDVFSVLTNCGGGVIQLSRQPIQSISSIETTDTLNVETTVDAETYALDVATGRILLNDGYSWPTDPRAQSAVTITYVAGYGASGATVPEPIRQAIQLYVLTMYENRACGDMPDAVKTLLDPFRTAEALGAW